MYDEKKIELVLVRYELTRPQLFCADMILNKLNVEDRNHWITESTYRSDIKKTYKLELTRRDVIYTRKILEDNLYLIDETGSNGGMYKINTEGRKVMQGYKTLIDYLISEVDQHLREMHSQSQEMEKQDKKFKLEVEALEKNIFQLKYSWLFIVGNAFLTIVVSLLVAYLVHRWGIK